MLASRFVHDLPARENVVVEAVSAEAYLESAVLAGEKGVRGRRPSVRCGGKKGVREIYTFASTPRSWTWIS